MRERLRAEIYSQNYLPIRLVKPCGRWGQYSLTNISYVRVRLLSAFQPRFWADPSAKSLSSIAHNWTPDIWAARKDDPSYNYIPYCTVRPGGNGRQSVRWIYEANQVASDRLPQYWPSHDFEVLDSSISLIQIGLQHLTRKMSRTGSSSNNLQPCPPAREI